MNSKSDLSREDVQDILPLTPAQEGILFHYLQAPESKVYHIQLQVDLKGVLDMELFQLSWNKTVQKNEALRTLFRWEGLGNPVQIILKRYEMKVKFSDRTELALLKKLKDCNGQLVLTEVPFTVELIKTEKNRYRMLICYHHIILDGWSIGLVIKDFLKNYELTAEQELGGKEAAGLKAFVQKCRAADPLKQRKYWLDYLGECEGKTSLSVKNQAIQENKAFDSYQIVLSVQLYKKINDFLKNSKVTMASFFYTVWGILLQNYNNQDDVLFGTTVSGRSGDDLKFNNLAGLLINTVPLRIRQGSNTCLEFMHRLMDVLAERAEYENTSLLDIYKFLKVDSREGLFDTIVVLNNYPLDDRITGSYSGLQITGYCVEEFTNYDLTLSINTFDGIVINFLYPEDLFQKEVIIQMAAHFIHISEEILNTPGQKLQEVPMLSEAERNHILYDFNKSVEIEEYNRPIYRLFEERVKKSPNHLALIFQNQHMTYDELNRKANFLARFLISSGIKNNTFVGICMERSFEMVIAILGIVKAGGAYVPFDPEYPKERLEIMFKDAQLHLVLTQRKFQHLLAETKPECIYLEEIYRNNGYESTNLEIEAKMSDAAYVIYTSGSTGISKGAINTHRGMLNHKQWMQRQFHLQESDRILQKTPFCFDVSIWEFFWTLSYGACLVIAEPGGHKDPGYLKRVIKENNISIIHFVPSMLQIFLESIDKEELASLRMVFVSGEALSDSLKAKFFSKCHIPLHNVYGPAECADVSTFRTYCYDEKSGVTIGKPIANVKVYILNKFNNICPVGITGELVIGGRGVGFGYLNHPELTAEKFVPDLFSDREGDMMYKTGDLGRYRSDGEIEYCGRSDYQIKIRGMRVELGEIEKVLYSFPLVKECVADVTGDTDANKMITAYIEGKEKSSLSDKEIKSYLRQKLPEHMIPARFVFLDMMPLLHNGKIDRHALRRYQIIKKEKTELSLSTIEAQIRSVWMEELQLEHLDITDNFFDIGGNSLSVLHITNRLSKIFHIELPVSTIFEYSTVRALAQHLSGDLSEERTQDGELAEESLLRQPSVVTREIAIIGMSGRFPGAGNFDQFWENIKSGKESITFFTNEELLDAGIEKELLMNPQYVKAKGVLEDVDCFDAEFFGYSPKEAAMTDPQLRTLHECVWEAFENAGYNPLSEDQDIGLFLGASPNYHWLNTIARKNKNSLDEFAALIHNEKDFLSTRIAYQLNLKGPVMTIQTACSTSLVCIDAAYQALNNNKCSMAVAGGIGVTFPQKTGYLYYDGMILSPDGHCHAFDEKAGGTVPGNGVGIVVLKRLADAIRDRDHIYAVIKGSAVNNDGQQKVGFTAPGIKGQIKVIQAAIQEAGIEKESISYIEAHGTGTKLGDVVECKALKDVFRDAGQNFHCKIGSVKTNVGHLDCASGVAGLIKTVMALHNKMIPPNINFNRMNENIDFCNSGLEISTTLTEWKNENYPLRAGVSSFGIGGTNAHIILEEYQMRPAEMHGRVPVLFTFSAKTEQALKRNVLRFADWMQRDAGHHINDIAFTMQVGRNNFPYRKTFVGSEKAEIVKQLHDYNLNSNKSNVVNTILPVVFSFAGVGSQYEDMGRNLYEQESYYRDIIDEGKKTIRLLSDADESEHVRIFLYEYATASLLMHWGIVPDFVIGYSFGEYTAACIGGVFTLREALALIITREKVLREYQSGAMLSVPMKKEDILKILPADLSIAIDNGDSCIIGGQKAMVEFFEEQLKEQRVMAIRLHNPYAMHTREMIQASREFLAKIENVKWCKPIIPYVSCITGTIISDWTIAKPEYWSAHLSSPIEYAKGVRQICSEGHHLFLTIGPGMELATLTRSIINKYPGHRIINIGRNESEQVTEQEYLIDKLGRLWMNGIKINWDNFYDKEKRNRIPLPTYSFEKNKFKMERLSNSEIGLVDSITPVQSDTVIRSDIKEWFYAPSWKRVTENGRHRDGIKLSGTILVFCDEYDIFIKLQKVAQWKQRKVILIKKGNGFEIEAENNFIINPRNQADYHALFGNLHRSDSLPEVIIHMWGIEREVQEKQEQRLKAATVSQFIDENYYCLLYLSKEIGVYMPEQSITLRVITNNLWEVTGEENINPQKAVITGPCNSIPVEYKNVTCSIIDLFLPPIGSPAEENMISMLAEELAEEFSTEQIAYRGKYRWIPSYEKQALSSTAQSNKLRKKGIYLISGGLGGIGLSLAKLLSKQVQARMILVNRSDFPKPVEWNQYLTEHSSEDRVSRLIHKINKIESYGGKIHIYKSDIADFEQMQSIKDLVEKEIGQINGVIHAAGIPDGGFIQTRTKEMSEKVFASKIMGTCTLDRLFKDSQLDFFMMCSSKSAILKTAGQVAYCSANAFEDAYAYYRKQVYSGFSASIGWEAWLDVGMAHDSIRKINDKENNSSAILVSQEGIHPEEGREIFSRVLENKAVHTIISVKPLADEIRISNIAGTTALLAGSKTDALLGTKPESEEDIVMILSNIIKDYFSIETVNINDNFFELGASSFDMVRINTRINEVMKREIPIVMLFKYSTINALAQYLNGIEDSIKSDSLPDSGSAGKFMNSRQNLQGRRQKTRGEINGK